MSQFFTSGGQSIGASASASVFLMNIQGWFPFGWTGWISLQSKGLLRMFPSKPHFKSINSLVLSFLYSPTLTSTHDYWKTHSFDYMSFASKVISLLFNVMSIFDISFLIRSKCLLILWLQSLSTVILEPKKRKSFTVSTFSFLFAMKWWDQMPWS